MDNQPIFKAAIVGGFEKQSVLNYIQEMIGTAQEAQDRFNAQIGEMSATREKLEHSVRELEQRLSDVEKTRSAMGEELHNAKVRNNELATMLESLGDEINRQKAIAAEKDGELRRFGAEKADLHRKNAALEQQTVELQQGRQEVEKNKLHIGEVMLQSRMDAERILEEATAKARDITEEAAATAEEILEKADLRAREREEEADKSLIAISEQFSAFRKDMELLEEKIEDAVLGMREKLSAISQTVSQGEGHIRGFYRPSHITLAPPAGGEEAAGQEEFFQNAAE